MEAVGTAEEALSANGHSHAAAVLFFLLNGYMKRSRRSSAYLPNVEMSVETTSETDECA